MNKWTRRDVLRTSAGAAAAVPMAALGTRAAAAAGDDVVSESDLADLSATGPVMFCVHDAKRGEVSILHGDDEVVIRDRRLVARILRAAKTSRGSHVVSS
jgi:hypothetical protein